MVIMMTGFAKEDDELKLGFYALARKRYPEGVLSQHDLSAYLAEAKQAYEGRIRPPIRLILTPQSDSPSAQASA